MNKKNRKLLAFKGARQTRIDKHLGKCYREDKGAGDHIDQVCGKEYVRIYFQNPRGVMKGNVVEGRVPVDPMDMLTLCQLRDLQVDVICLAETNINWNNKEVCAK